jgi:enolase-phosphatase E1
MAISTALSLRAATVLLDVEGTIGSKTFLSQVLAPYARDHLPAYIAAHATEPAVAQALHDTRALAGIPGADATHVLLDWIAQDRKAPPLKKLQGLVWRKGFEEGAFAGHLFDDAVQALRAWHAAGLPLAIYSSGSVQAQKLYFSHSAAGNVAHWFTAHFDTDVGAKTAVSAYLQIAQKLHQIPWNLLFLSDSAAELEAAQGAGLQVVQVVREDTVADARFAQVQSFDQLQVLPLP